MLPTFLRSSSRPLFPMKMMMMTLTTGRLRRSFGSVCYIPGVKLDRDSKTSCSLQEAQVCHHHVDNQRVSAGGHRVLHQLIWVVELCFKTLCCCQALLVAVNSSTEGRRLNCKGKNDVNQGWDLDSLPGAQEERRRGRQWGTLFLITTQWTQESSLNLQYSSSTSSDDDFQQSSPYCVPPPSWWCSWATSSSPSLLWAGDTCG